MNAFSKEMEGLSSAEDIFAHFGVAYEPRILSACRLHILKRFHDYLDGIEQQDPSDLHIACRRQLERAYADFATGPALQQNAFPRLARIKGAFVALSAVRLPQKTQPTT